MNTTANIYKVPIKEFLGSVLRNGLTMRIYMGVGVSKTSALEALRLLCPAYTHLSDEIPVYENCYGTDTGHVRFTAEIKVTDDVSITLFSEDAPVRTEPVEELTVEEISERLGVNVKVMASE